MGEMHAQALDAAEFNRSLNQQRKARFSHMQKLWQCPQKQPPVNPAQPTITSDSSSIPQQASQTYTQDQMPPLMPPTQQGCLAYSSAHADWLIPLDDSMINANASVRSISMVKT
jgi:hypothetical protein